MLSVQAVSLCMDTNEVVNSIVYVKILDNEKQVQQAAFWEYNKMCFFFLYYVCFIPFSEPGCPIMHCLHYQNRKE